MSKAEMVVEQTEDKHVKTTRVASARGSERGRHTKTMGMLL